MQTCENSVEETALTYVEVAQRIGVRESREADIVREHRLLSLTREGVKYIPEVFLNKTSSGWEVNKFIPGVIALLADGGYSDAEIIHYLFVEDLSLPGRPVDALHGHRAREVMRRAQAMAF